MWADVLKATAHLRSMERDQSELKCHKVVLPRFSFFVLTKCLPDFCKLSILEFEESVVFQFLTVYLLLCGGIAHRRSIYSTIFAGFCLRMVLS